MPDGFDLGMPPFRRDFDNARDPYTARNALSVPEEALSSGKLYGRKNRAWVDMNAVVIPLLGVTDGSSAAAGVAGETKSGAQGTPQTLTTATTLSLASISVPAGDWEIQAAIGFSGNVATTINVLFSDISTTVNTLTGSIDHSTTVVLAGATGFNFAANIWVPTPRFPVTFSGANVTYYVNAFAVFGVSTCQATGKIWARRMR